MTVAVIASTIPRGRYAAGPGHIIITPASMSRLRGKLIDRVVLTESAFEISKAQRRSMAGEIIPAVATAPSVLDIHYVLSHWIEDAPAEEPTCCKHGRSCYGCAMAGLEA